MVDEIEEQDLFPIAKKRKIENGIKKKEKLIENKNFQLEAEPSIERRVTRSISNLPRSDGRSKYHQFYQVRIYAQQQANS